MPSNRKGWLRKSLILLMLPLLAGCSMLFRRPSPEKSHVQCHLDYSIGEPAEENLEFKAWTMPYDPETFLLSLPDQLLHSALAPGRHLTAPLVVQGADCAAPLWPRDYRLPLSPDPAGTIRCTRQALSEVHFSVQTVWGSCSASIPQGGEEAEYRQSSRADEAGP